MPKMDDGPADGPPGRELRTVSVRLTAAEAQELLETLSARSEDDFPDPGYHLHIADDDGRELTIWRRDHPQPSRESTVRVAAPSAGRVFRNDPRAAAADGRGGCGV
jgi:hypothetical protein